MFWFKKEKPVKTEEEELKENPLRNRLRILFDNLCTFVDYKICDDRLKFILNHCYYFASTSNFRKIKIKFESKLGPVEITMTFEHLNNISLEYKGMNKFYFGIYCYSKISTDPVFSRQSNINSEIVDLALYELEHYIEEKHLDKASLESYNARELNKLIRQSAERIKDTQ